MEATSPAPVTPAPNHPKFVRWAVVLGIVIVLNVFFLVLRTMIFPAPQYNDYCKVNVPQNAMNAAECAAQGGVWTEYGAIAPVPQSNPNVSAGYCDYYATCGAQYDAANKQYELYAFALTMTLGLIALVVGIFLVGSSIVASGLSYGGVVALVIGSASYWSAAGNWLRLGISFIALVALLYIGYKRFKD